MGMSRLESEKRFNDFARIPTINRPSYKLLPVYTETDVTRRRRGKAVENTKLKLCISGSERKWISSKVQEINGSNAETSPNVYDESLRIEWLVNLIRPVGFPERHILKASIPLLVIPKIPAIRNIPLPKVHLPKEAKPEIKPCTLPVIVKIARIEEIPNIDRNRPNTAVTDPSSIDYDLDPYHDIEKELQFEKIRVYPEDPAQPKRQIETPWGWT